jgi:hypothetical protein
MPFKDPGSTTSLPLDELEGSLLLLEVHEQIDEIQTTFGPAQPIRADVHALDGPHKGGEYVDALIFPRVLIGQLRGSIGSRVLGRLGKGVPKAGQSAPWRLELATAADRAIGERWEAEHATSSASTSIYGDEEPF